MSGPQVIMARRPADVCSGWSHGGRPRCARRTPTMRTQRTPTVARRTPTMRTPQSQRAVARVFDIGSHNAFSWMACSACCGNSRLPRVCIQRDACMSDMIFLLATPGSTAVTGRATSLPFTMPLRRDWAPKMPEKYPHRESVSGWGGFSLGVLIASCTANLNVH